jgi:hypothetical protein
VQNNLFIVVCTVNVSIFHPVKFSFLWGSVGVAIVYAPVIDLFFSNTCHCFIKTNWISMHASISQYSKKVWHHYIGHSWIIIQNFNQWQYLLVFLDPYIQKYRIIIYWYHSYLPWQHGVWYGIMYLSNLPWQYEVWYGIMYLSNLPWQHEVSYGILYLVIHHDNMRSDTV